MSKRKILFRVIEDKAEMVNVCSPDVKITAIKFTGGSKISLIALNDAVEQLQFFYPEVEWNLEIDPTLPFDQLIAQLLPIQVSL